VSAGAGDGAPWPANELEAAMVRAEEHRDRSYLLRALARSVLCVAAPADLGGEQLPGRPLFRRLDPATQPLPLADGRDGRRYLLAYSSSHRLFRTYRDAAQRWLQTPAGELALRTGPGVPWMLNADGPGPVIVLEAADVAAVGLLAQGRPVREAYSGGGASTLVLEAIGPRGAELGPVVAAALGGSPVRRVVGARARWDEPGARPWLRLGLDAEDTPVEEMEPVARRLVAALEAATPETVEVRLMRPSAERRADTWLGEHGVTVWAAG
jgi:hypothetical protein